MVLASEEVSTTILMTGAVENYAKSEKQAWMPECLMLQKRFSGYGWLMRWVKKELHPSAVVFWTFWKVQSPKTKSNKKAPKVL